MAVQLLIRDGSPHWYLSPDIWVVPGSDPNGAIGSPIAGSPAYLWAHVANTGSTDANGVQVRFYWANPALQVLRSTATLVGSAFADVPAGGAQDVLCLVPWMPIVVNDGHECLVAEAIHAGDPLPSPPPDDFDPPTFRQVAQKNLTVLMARMLMSSMAITIAAPKRKDKKVTVLAETGGTLDERTLLSLGLKGFKPARAQMVDVGLDRESRCHGKDEPLGKKELEVALSRGTTTAVYAAIRAKDLADREYSLVRITEREGDKILGGLAYVVVADGRRTS
jgi:hypothetical protein